MSTRVAIDQWLERFLRRDASLAAPESTMGSQLERLRRNQTDSSGRKFKKPKFRPAINVVTCRACSGAGCNTCGGGGKVGECFGHEVIEYLVCKDDSAAHNAAHRADAVFADHGVDLMVWSSLDPVGREILWRQRQPVYCPGSYQRAQRVKEADKSSCSHDIVRRLAEYARIGGCDSCSAVFELSDQGEPMAQLVCRVCGLSERLSEVADQHGKPKAMAQQHVRRVRMKVQRRLAERRDGDGSELIRPLELDAEGFAWMWHYELVRRAPDDIARELGITERQLRTHVTAARRQIATALGDEDVAAAPVPPPAPSPPAAQPDRERVAELLADALDMARLNAEMALRELTVQWGLSSRVSNTVSDTPSTPCEQGADTVNGSPSEGLR